MQSPSLRPGREEPWPGLQTLSGQHRGRVLGGTSELKLGRTVRGQGTVPESSVCPAHASLRLLPSRWPLPLITGFGRCTAQAPVGSRVIGPVTITRKRAEPLHREGWSQGRSQPPPLGPRQTELRGGHCRRPQADPGDPPGPQEGHAGGPAAAQPESSLCPRSSAPCTAVAGATLGKRATPRSPLQKAGLAGQEGGGRRRLSPSPRTFSVWRRMRCPIWALTST